jgi:vacuolar-type H+-ATPase subunit F/Vma7
MTVRVIGSEEVVATFALAGMRGDSVASREEALVALAGLSAENVRIVLIEELTADQIRNEVNGMKLDAKAPLVVEIPGFAGPVEGRRSPLEMVRRALGIPL